MNLLIHHSRREQAGTECHINDCKWKRQRWKSSPLTIILSSDWNSSTVLVRPGWSTWTCPALSRRIQHGVGRKLSEKSTLLYFHQQIDLSGFCLSLMNAPTLLCTFSLPCTDHVNYSGFFGFCTWFCHVNGDGFLHQI